MPTAEATQEKIMAATVRSRSQKAKKGYKQASAAAEFGKIVVIDELIILYT